MRWIKKYCWNLRIIIQKGQPIREENLSADELKNMKEGDLESWDKLKELAADGEKFGLSTEAVISQLVEMGAVIDGIPDLAGPLVEGMEQSRKETEELIASYTSLDSLLGSQSAGKSISLEAFDSEGLTDYQSCLESVNGTMRINEESARALAKTKSKTSLIELVRNQMTFFLANGCFLYERAG